jgi:hypothetical protein
LVWRQEDLAKNIINLAAPIQIANNIFDLFIVGSGQLEP